MTCTSEILLHISFSAVDAVSNPLGEGSPDPSPFDLTAKECAKPHPAHKTPVPRKCPSSPKDEQWQNRK
ncbi:hypothetical protein TNCV_2832361 [Trichonephila clavipes]|nr:hypothetical protein TNCV_2832361 [Trichonephila clavipes]